MNETYEELRDSTTGDLGAAWKGADRKLSELKESYRALKEDPRYTDEYKAEKAWQSFDRLAEGTAEGREETRRIFEGEITYHEKMARPRPKGETLETFDTERLIAAQNQAARVVRMVERQERLAEGSPLRRKNPVEILAAEYERGLATGGVEGASSCKGVLMAAEELGIAEESFLDKLRNEANIEHLQKAQRYRIMVGALSKTIPEPPFAKPLERTTALAERPLAGRPLTARFPWKR